MALFSQAYPTLTRWIKEQGWKEIGADEYSASLVRALDPSGLVWESAPECETVDEALAALEDALEEWFEQQAGA
jgi:hypothetical protein